MLIVRNAKSKKPTQHLATNVHAAFFAAFRTFTLRFFAAFFAALNFLLRFVAFCCIVLRFAAFCCFMLRFGAFCCVYSPCFFAWRTGAGRHGHADCPVPGVHEGNFWN